MFGKRIILMLVNELGPGTKLKGELKGMVVLQILPSKIGAMLRFVVDAGARRNRSRSALSVPS